MKFAILFLLAVLAVSPFADSVASEAAPDPESAVQTLRAGIAVHPDQAVVLFQDSLQTNPDCRQDLLVGALEILGDDPEILTRLLYVARIEFPEDDNLFAEAALSVVPDLATEIRACFLAAPERMGAVLAGAPLEAIEQRGPSEESRKLDEEIRDAIARVSAKAEGKAWPEQAIPDEPVRFKKPDEVRISRQSRRADEVSLFNHLPLDRQDERELAPGLVKIDDSWKPSDAIRLDESKFAKDREATTAPFDAKSRVLAPAGLVALPKRPRLARSSVYYIPPAAGSFESTIDLERGETPPPAVVIRPEAASPTTPR